MKTFVCVLLLVAFVAAEPPRYRFARFRVQREELSEGPKEGEKGPAEEAPYAAAGYKPSEEFKLPSHEEVRPSFRAAENSYNVPFKTHIAPRPEYGVPERREGKERSEGEKKEKEGEMDKEGEKHEGEAENFKEGEEKKENLKEEPKGQSEVETAHGVYYVLVPNPQLERVQYQTENDLRNMEYTARLQFKPEERAPLFVYTGVPQYQSASYVQLI